MNQGLSLALAFSFFVLGQGCSEDEPRDGNNTSIEDMGQDATADVPEDAEPDQFVPPVYSTFEVKVCQDQFGDKVTIYAEHTEPSGCFLLTLSREEASASQSLVTDEGWRLLAASVVDDSGCPSEIPGDQSQHANVDQVSGEVSLEYAIDGYPVTLTEGRVEVALSESNGNPFGTSVLKVEMSDIPVLICPGGPVDE